MFKKPQRSRDDFTDEIGSHIEIEADRLVEQGMDRDEAMATARRTFGNVTSARERFYESSRWMWLDALSRNIRYAWRRLRSSPLSTATIIVSLALGIGFNTAIFSLADQALLRTLPVERPEELVQLRWDGPFEERGMGNRGYGNQLPHLLYRELREENDVFVDMFARASEEAHLTVGHESAAVTVELMSRSYFQTLGARPVLGRLFDDNDDQQRDAHPVVVLAYEYWQTHFGADPAVIGDTVLINSYPMTVIGVAEQRFHGTDWSLPPNLWIPVMMKSRVTPS
jgi:hypothetical protein